MPKWFDFFNFQRYHPDVSEPIKTIVEQMKARTNTFRFYSYRESRNTPFGFECEFKFDSVIDSKTGVEFCRKLFTTYKSPINKGQTRLNIVSPFKLTDAEYKLLLKTGREVIEEKKRRIAVRKARLDQKKRDKILKLYQ